MKVLLIEFVTLDGVSQGPGSATEDPSDDFTRGGWLVPYLDELFVRRTSLLLLEYDHVGAAPVAEYEGVTAFV
jgi:hypothetical protein